jgi:hypothetical protein
VEFTVVKSSDEKNHPVGSKATWFQALKDKDIAFGSLKEFIYPVLGLSYPRDKERITKEVDPKIEEILYAACDKSDIVPEGKNAFAGQKVRVQTRLKKTAGKGQDFTQHDWSPYAAAA